MAEVVGKVNDTVVQCENCKSLVKYTDSDIEYVSKHFSETDIVFSKKIICPCCHMESILVTQNGFRATVSKQNQN